MLRTRLWMNSTRWLTLSSRMPLVAAMEFRYSLATIIPTQAVAMASIMPMTMNVEGQRPDLFIREGKSAARPVLPVRKAISSPMGIDRRSPFMQLPATVRYA